MFRMRLPRVSKTVSSEPLCSDSAAKDSAFDPKTSRTENSQRWKTEVPLDGRAGLSASGGERLLSLCPTNPGMFWGPFVIKTPNFSFKQTLCDLYLY